MGGTGTAALLAAVASLNVAVDSDTAILPGLYADEVNEDWFVFQGNIATEAGHHFTGRRTLATIALAANAVLNEAQIEEVIERSLRWSVDGYYVIAETPGSYLVNNPIWMANLLSLLAGLKLQGREVVLGYANHQLLAAACANVDVLCTGTWMNVRAFSTQKFMQPDDSIKRKATWYYAPSVLSEYKLPFLDIAQRTGLLHLLAPPPGYPTTFSAPLFAGGQPSAVGWKEPTAFRHYLCTVRHQVAEVTAGSFDAALDAQERSLDGAERLLDELRHHGVLGQNREFGDAIDANRAGLAVLRTTRGARLRREWQ